MRYNDTNGMETDGYIGKHDHGRRGGPGRRNTSGTASAYGREPAGSGARYRGEQSGYRREAPRGGGEYSRRPPQGSRMQSPAQGRGRAITVVKLALIAAAVLAGLYYITVTVTLSGVNTKRVDTGWEDRPAQAVGGVPLEGSAVSDIILLIGADDDGSEGTRSDTIMYASIHRLTGRVRLCSVLRDSYVEIPGYRANKINAAFSLGSDELCMRTMESNFRIRTDKYIRVNMQALITAIDRLGGVELELSADEAKAINSHFAPGSAVEGKQTLGGRYAVYFARIRKTDDDFHRVSRQRLLISAIGKKSLRSSPVKVCSAVNGAAPYVTTNLSPSRLSAVGTRIALAMSTGRCEQMTVPIDGTWSYQEIDGQSCVRMDIRANAMAARDFLFFRD